MAGLYRRAGAFRERSGCWRLGLLLLLVAAPAAAEGEGAVELSTLTCRQAADLEPPEVQATLLGALVGYAMGQGGATFDLASIEIWYGGLSALCNEAPDVRLLDLIPLIGDRGRAMTPE